MRWIFCSLNASNSAGEIFMAARYVALFMRYILLDLRDLIEKL